MGHRFNYFVALILFLAAITFILIALISTALSLVRLRLKMPLRCARVSRSPLVLHRPRLQAFISISCPLFPLSSFSTHVTDDKRNWWTVSVDCTFFPPGLINVQYGPLGYWLPNDDSGTSFSSKSSDACYPLRTASGGNQDLRYIGIVAVIVMAIAVLFAFGALLQVIAALFELGHAHHHAKRSAHAAIRTYLATLIY